MNKYCRTIFPFSWEVIIFPGITTYLPHYCSKYWTLFQHKCTNLVDRTYGIQDHMEFPYTD